jgi:tetratricopeptide (TPR) repeat protein
MVQAAVDLKPGFYAAKEDFDRFVSALPKDESQLAPSARGELALAAWKLFQAGIPHRHRPMCLYYFYHFLPLDSEAATGESVSQLYDASVSSLLDREVRKYVSLLNGEELFEVCQQRGTLKLIALSLPEFVLDDAKFSEWDSIKRSSEEFLNGEAAPPISFLESYMYALQHYCYKTKRADANLYKSAVQVLDLSTDLRAIEVARSLVNDDGNLRAYQRSQCQPRDAKKILALESLEEQVMAEFGHAVRISNTVGKALGMLTKASRERRAAEKDYQSQWVGRIKGTGNSAVPYVSGYAEYLCAWVYMGTDDIKKALKSLERALESGFDPGIVLTFLHNINDTLKNRDAAARWAQRLLDYTNVGSLQEAEGSEFDRSLMLTIKAAGLQPQFSSRFWNTILTTNSEKQGTIIGGLEPKIRTARNENLQQRTEAGIALLDSLISTTETDEALANGKSLSDISIETPKTELINLSLEEIDLFTTAGQDQLLLFTNPTIELHAAIEYVRSLHHLRYSDIGRDVDQSIAVFPNLMASIPVFKDLVSQCANSGQLAAAQKLTSFAISKRPQTKVVGFYGAIQPLRKAVHRDRPPAEEIVLIAKTRRLLHDPELAEATRDLTEAYVAALTTEKSLTEKDRLLKGADSEGLADERLSAIRSEVTALLERRKKIIIWTALISGAVLLIVIIIAALVR